MRVTEDEMNKIRKSLPYLAGLSINKNGTNVIFCVDKKYFDVPVKEVLNIVQYLKTFHPYLGENSKPDFSSDEDFQKLLS